MNKNFIKIFSFIFFIFSFQFISGSGKKDSFEYDQMDVIYNPYRDSDKTNEFLLLRLNDSNSEDSWAMDCLYKKIQESKKSTKSQQYVKSILDEGSYRICFYNVGILIREYRITNVVNIYDVTSSQHYQVNLVDDIYRLFTIAKLKELLNFVGNE